MSKYKFQEAELEKKIEQVYLDGSAFAIVFLRAKHAGGTVLHMQLWTLDISFNVYDLWTIKQKKFISL